MRLRDIGNHAAIHFGLGNKRNGLGCCFAATLCAAAARRGNRLNLPVWTKTLKVRMTDFGRFGNTDAMPPFVGHSLAMHWRYAARRCCSARCGRPASGTPARRFDCRTGRYVFQLAGRLSPEPSFDRLRRQSDTGPLIRVGARLVPCSRKRRPGRSTHEPGQPTDGPRRRRTAVAPTGHAHRAAMRRGSDWPARSPAG